MNVEHTRIVDLPKESKRGMIRRYVAWWLDDDPFSTPADDALAITLVTLLGLLGLVLVGCAAYFTNGLVLIPAGLFGGMFWLFLQAAREERRAAQ